MTFQPEALDAPGLSAVLSRASTPLLVDFWAPWCAPCRATMPVFEQLAGELAGRCAFATVNVEAHPQLARQFEVRAIPTILLFSGGKVVGRAVGAQSREQLLELVGAIV